MCSASAENSAIHSNLCTNILEHFSNPICRVHADVCVGRISGNCLSAQRHSARVLHCHIVGIVFNVLLGWHNNWEGACAVSFYFFFLNNKLGQGKAIAPTAYFCGWYNFGTRFRRDLVIFLSHAQQPFTLKAGGLFIVSLDTFGKVYRVITE